jgi:hypothetical protein
MILAVTIPSIALTVSSIMGDSHIDKQQRLYCM